MKVGDLVKYEEDGDIGVVTVFRSVDGDPTLRGKCDSWWIEWIKSPGDSNWFDQEGIKVISTQREGRTDEKQ